MSNLQKWVNLSFLASSILAWIFLREIFTLIFDSLGWMHPEWLIAPSDVGGIVSGLMLFVFLWRSSKANEYLTGVLAELAKVTWPKRKETALSTVVVAVMLAIATLAVLLFDSICKWISEQWLY